MKLENRLSNEQIKARLILVVAIGLTLAFLASILALLYGLLFVTQPLEVSPNDNSAWAVLSPMLATLTGGLLGVLAGNGISGKQQPPQPPAPPAP
jgi:predicted ABC-type sugar transport system permease subunit